MLRNRTLAAVAIGATLVQAPPSVPASTYDAITDRVTRPKPGTASPAAAGGRFTDIVFGSRMLRVTDENTRPAAWRLSYRSPSGSHQNAWSATGNYFYVVSTDGAVVPFAFDRTSMTAFTNQSVGGRGWWNDAAARRRTRVQLFRRLLVRRVYSGPGANLRTIAAYDFARAVYTPLLDLDRAVPGLGGTGRRAA